MKGPESSQQPVPENERPPTPEDFERANRIKREVAALFAEAAKLPYGFRLSSKDDTDSDLAISPEGYIVGIPKRKVGE